jgi:hypothetical protein
MKGQDELSTECSTWNIITKEISISSFAEFWKIDADCFYSDRVASSASNPRRYATATGPGAPLPHRKTNQTNLHYPLMMFHVEHLQKQSTWDEISYEYPGICSI